MKKSSLAIVIALVVFIVIAWGVNIFNSTSQLQERNVHLKSAAKYMEEGLYQKAIAEYDTALAMKDEMDVKLKWLEAYDQGYQDNVVTYTDYANALMQMCEQQPTDGQYWERVIHLYINNDKMTKAHEVYMASVKEGAKSEQLTALGDVILYSYRSTAKAYAEVIEGANGAFSVNDGEGWGLIEPTGDTLADCDYQYVGPYNSSGHTLKVTDKDKRLFDGEEVVQAIIDKEFTRCGAYAEGLLPVMTGDKYWKYLDCENDTFVLETYEMASNFSDSVAAVNKNGKWSLINRTGETVCSETFDNIKLAPCGDYVRDGIMIASQKGKYGIYNAEGRCLVDLNCTDMDVYMGGYIAFQASNGKWGYVDSKGNEVISAQYDHARSFSGNLAAVCKDGLWGFIKNDGTVVIELQYMDARYFNANGICFISEYTDLYSMIKLRFV